MSAFDSPEIDVGPDRAAELLAAGAEMIDVREPYEREAGHIEGSRHIELERLASRAPEIDRGRAVIFQCRLGTRSAMAATAFRGAGYEAYSLAGGIVGWAAAGHPVVGEIAEH